jgi:hypothetical protein
VLPVLAIGLLVAAADPGAALLEGASASKSSAERERLLRGWASLGGAPEAPPGLSADAQRALSWVLEAGRFRLFASRQGGRLKLGLHDPAAMVTRLDVLAVVGEQSLALPRAQSDEPGRLDYTIDPALPERTLILVQAYARAPGGDVLVRELRLEPHEVTPLPAAPDPNAKAPIGRRHLEVAPPADASPVIPWWWIAVGAVAAGFVGAAIWQETR